MNTQKHIIHRQVLDIQVDRQDHVFPIQNRLSSLANNEIMDVLDGVCSTVADPDHYIRLDSIEIDLGAVSLTNLEGEFTEKLRECFYEALLVRADQIRIEQQPEVEISHSKSTFRDYMDLKSSQTDTGFVSQYIHDLELLQHFLRTGTFPWWAEKLTSELLEKMCFELLDQVPHDFRLLIEEELCDGNARHRMIYQFSDSLLLGISSLIVPEKSEQIQGYVIDYYEVYKQNQFALFPEHELRLYVWDAVIVGLLKRHQRELTEKEMFQYTIKRIVERYSVDFKTFYVSLKSAVDSLSDSGFVFKSDFHQLIQATDSDRLFEQVEINSQQTDFEDEQSRIEDIDIIHDHADLNKEDTNLVIKQGEFDSLQTDYQDQKSQLDGETADDEICIENSGLVILWPYLNIFYENVGLLKDGVFIDESSVKRAIHLLQYMVTGEQETPEYFLTLNKLLCGWDTSKPLSKDFTISDREKSESTNLLNTVIAHWSALKNTSIKGFRASFLHRNGILVKKGNSWLLKVERKSYDLLLEHLPWTISMVKLSWMKTILQIEW